MSIRGDNSDVRVFDRIDIMPGDSRVSFRGSISMTKSTVTVYKEPMHRGEESLFIGVCSIPLIQFFHHKNHITLMRGNSFLFDNAALSAGIDGYASSSNRGTSNNSPSAVMHSSIVDTPTAWQTVTMQFETADRCQRVVDSLNRRNAEETNMPPFPVQDVPRPSSRNGGRAGTPNSYHSKHNNYDSTPHSPYSQKPMSSRVSERPAREESGSRQSAQPISSARSSRLPSRRELDDGVHSVRSSADSSCSSRLPSRREHDDLSSQRTISRKEVISTPSSRVASSGNARAAPRANNNPAEREYQTNTRQAKPRGHTPTQRREEDTYMDYSNSVSPRSTVNNRRTENEYFLRSIQKLQHHRLHVMQYLHKEMVHQAFLAAEARVKGGAANGRSTSAGRRASTLRGRSAGRSRSVAAEESARLKEIEARLAEVEALHREAERERDAAVRLRRDYEVRTGRGSTFVNSQPSHSAASSSHPANRGAVVPHTHQNAGALIPYPDDAIPAREPDEGVSIVDRYIFGDEWDKIFPAYEADVRFNAQVDVCLALNLPRHRVSITYLVVDQPGLRVTAEVAHDHNVMTREMVDRRISSSPFRFLQRMYDMRDMLAANGESKSIAGRKSSAPRAIQSATPRKSSSRRQSTSRRNRGPYDDCSSLSEYDEAEAAMDADTRRRALNQRTEDRIREAEKRMQKKTDRLRSDVRRQVREYLSQLEDDQEYARDTIMLSESKERQALNREARRHVSDTITNSMATVEENELIARATIEVGNARQMQVLMAAHRRQIALHHLKDSERERRREIHDLEAIMRQDLNNVMNPGTTHDRFAQLLEDERRRRQRTRTAEEKSRRMLMYSMGTFLSNCASDDLHDLLADERAARAAIVSEALSNWLAVMYSAPSSNGSSSRRRVLAQSPDALSMLREEMLLNEAADRKEIVAEEARRRNLFRREAVLQREAVVRDAIEVDELDARGAILDAMVLQNRQELERRINDREKLAGLMSEEEFYRKTIMADEADAFGVIAELFAAGLKDLLALIAEAPEPEDLTPRRRRITSPRSAKPFHYMTFSPEDMDFAPSAALAIEGMLGCSINKNLEVVSISRPLPKAEDEDVQFQAGDMILDVAGHSLHSLSHLREVLSSRALQIQSEAKEEFMGLPEGQYTHNPAMQKYLEVLCEHHNFLVQVLRGCDIYQIIVRS